MTLVVNAHFVGSSPGTTEKSFSVQRTGLRLMMEIWYKSRDPALDVSVQAIAFTRPLFSPSWGRSPGNVSFFFLASFEETSIFLPRVLSLRC